MSMTTVCLTKLGVLLTLLPVPACGSDRVTYVDGALVPEIDRWAQDCRQNLPSYRCTTSKIDEIVLVDEFENDTIGQCEISWEWSNTGYTQHRKITILKGVKLGSYYMRALIAHEMFHCQFDIREHTEKGIMATRAKPEWEVKAKWVKLITEAYELVKK